MNRLLKNLKHMNAHEQVTGKKAQQWYSVDDTKKIISFCVQDKLKNKDGTYNNIVNFSEGIAETCIGGNEYIFERFVKRKRCNYKVRLFIKKFNEVTFDEVEVRRWKTLEDRITFYFKIGN